MLTHFRQRRCSILFAASGGYFLLKKRVCHFSFAYALSFVPSSPLGAVPGNPTVATTAEAEGSSSVVRGLAIHRPARNRALGLHRRVGGDEGLGGNYGVPRTPIN